MISVIIPTKDEARTIRNMLAQFEDVILSDGARPVAKNSHQFEVIISDASSDKTTEIARDYAKKTLFPMRVISSAPGRALQMNEGARQARGDILLFLHADTFLPEGGLMLIKEACHIPCHLEEELSCHSDSPRDEGSRPRWGGFCLRFEELQSDIGTSWLLKWIAWRSNFRLKVFKIVYGDQALFVERKLFEEMGGFRDMPILEDLDISKRLRSRARMAYIQEPVTTSPRRFLKNGILRVYIKMFCVLLMYKLSINPDKIKRFYEKANEEQRSMAQKERAEANVLILFAKYPEAGQVKTRLAKALGGEKAAHLYQKFLFDLCEAHQKKDYDLIIAFSPKAKEKAFKDLLKAYVLRETQFYAQEGDDLGQRMYGAFKAKCHSEHNVRGISRSLDLRHEWLWPRDDGKYEKMVLIGSDLPDLGEDIVQQAFRILDQTDVVLGPAYDGGYYLIGMKRAFDIFQGISWSAPSVLKEQLRNIREKKLSYHLLAVRRDIDTMEDLEASLRLQSS